MKTQNAMVETSANQRDFRENPLVYSFLSALKGVALVATNLELRISFANPYACEILGLDIRQIEAGKGLLPAMMHKRILAELKKSSTEFIQQYALEDQLRTLKVTASCLKDEAGKDSGYVLHMHDITDQVAIELELRHTETMLRSLINASPDFICFKDGKGRWLEANTSGLELFQLDHEHCLKKTDTELADNTHPIYREVFRHSQALDEHAWNTGEMVRGEQTIPLLEGGEKTFDVIKVPLFNDDGSRHGLVTLGRDITESKHSQDRLYELVNHDSLTGLPNRRLFNELMGHSIKRAEREQNRVALLFVDLDRFKAINDTLGHDIGDKLLFQVARRISCAVRESDAVARGGGDEFLVMMDFLHDAEDAAVVAKKIINSLQTEFIIDDRELFIGASIGIAIYPEDSTDVDGLIKSADIAMYQVKHEGKNNYCFYSTNLSEDAVERFTLENQLRRALERDQFEVFYQPQISLESGRIVGAEALIRWRHPELGMVSPVKFIPLAEETGLIVPIGEWVLRESARQAMQWVAQGHALQWISINVSGVQIQRSNFPDTVYGILVETGCEPGLLELEITESTVMHNTEFVIGVFDRIKRMGVKLAIDDFGTGYSSLSHLKRLPLDKLKIDQSFVRGLPHNANDAAIVNAINALALNLGFTVIAEGVETTEQADFLRLMGCNEAQGYLYSRPVTASEFALLLANERRQGAEGQ